MIKTSNICIEKVVDCHLDVFPDSIYNTFSRKLLVKTFKWYLINLGVRQLISYEKDGLSHGFLTMRKIDDPDSYYRYIFITLIIELIKYPKMIINRAIISKIISKISDSKPSLVLRNSFTMELVSIGVRCESRHEGIGKKLINKFEEISKASLCKKMILKVKKYNTSALNFYVSCGWSQVGTCSNFIILNKEI